MFNRRRADDAPRHARFDAQGDVRHRAQPAAQLDVSAERADDLANQRKVLGLPIKRGGEVNKVKVRRALFAPFRGKVNGIAEDGHVVAPALAETHGIAIEHINRGVKLHGKPSFGG